LPARFLTGKYRSESDLAKSPRGGGVKKYLDERGLRILGALDQVAQEKHSTPGKVALAWLLARPSITAPIASATSVRQLQDLIDAATLALDPASIDLLNQAGAWAHDGGLKGHPPQLPRQPPVPYTGYNLCVDGPPFTIFSTEPALARGIRLHAGADPPSQIRARVR
jgi:hypothetical protein